MPWKDDSQVELRVRFVLTAKSGYFSVSELCESFGVSRKTGYKWLARYSDGGVSNLGDLPRAPRNCPHRTGEVIAGKIIKCRTAHPDWGARKILANLATHDPAIAELLCSPSAATRIMKAQGLIQSKRRRRRSSSPSTCPPVVADEPNDLWCADYKGQFKMKNGRYCYPLTVTDAHSRFILLCDGLDSTEHVGTIKAFNRLFSEVGLPKMIRTDNGVPFCSVAVGGLSRLSMTWIQLGIIHQRSRPGKPQDNGRHERMHRTLKAATARPPGANLASQQLKFNDFVQEFNNQRPHEALQMKCPASIWTPSSREMPTRIPKPEYPGHFEVRSIRTDGTMNFKGLMIYVTNVLIGQRVGLEEIEDGIWSIYYYSTLLARYDERKQKVIVLRS